MPKFQNCGNLRSRNTAGKPSGNSPLQVIQREARHMGTEARCHTCTHWTAPDTSTELVDIGRCAQTGRQQTGYGTCLKWKNKS